MKACPLNDNGNAICQGCISKAGRIMVRETLIYPPHIRARREREIQRSLGKVVRDLDPNPEGNVPTVDLLLLVANEHGHINVDAAAVATGARRVCAEIRVAVGAALEESELNRLARRLKVAPWDIECVSDDAPTVIDVAEQLLRTAWTTDEPQPAALAA